MAKGDANQPELTLSWAVTQILVTYIRLSFSRLRAFCVFGRETLKFSSRKGKTLIFDNLDLNHLEVFL